MRSLSVFCILVCFWILFPSHRAHAQTDFSEAIRLGVGEVARAEGPVNQDDVVISFPFEYRRTGTLRNDVRGNGRAALGTLYAAAGTPGYLLGNYRFGSGDVGTPIWCFFRPEHIDIDHIICFFGGYQGVSTVLDFVGRPLLISHFEMSARNNRTADAPIVENGPVTLPFELRAIFRFQRWRGNTVVLSVSNGDYDLGHYYVEPDASGQTILRTVAGAVRFSRDDERQTVVERADDEADAPQQLLAELVSSGALAVESALRVLDAPAPHDFVSISRNQDLFSQRVTPASAMRQEASPKGDDAFGEPGALLFPVMRGMHPVMCWRAYPYRFLNWSSRMQADCLEDADDDGLYEVMWQYVVYRDTEAFFVSRITGPPDILRIPVRLTDAPEAALPESQITLSYVGPTRERRSAGDQLEVAAVGFRWILGRGQDPRVIEVALDDDGAGTLAISGVELGLIRNVVVVSGAAEFRLTGGLPLGGPTYLSGRALTDPSRPAPE